MARGDHDAWGARRADRGRVLRIHRGGWATIGTMRDMDYRRWIGESAVMAGLIVVVINLAQGDVGFAVVLLVVLAGVLGGLLWWTRPGYGGPHISHAAARAAAGDGDVIVYWRPG